MIGAIVGDFFFGQGKPGLGQVLKRLRRNNQSELLFATVIVASLLGVAVFLFFGWLSRGRSGRWYDTEQRRERDDLHQQREHSTGRNHETQPTTVAAVAVLGLAVARLRR